MEKRIAGLLGAAAALGALSGAQAAPTPAPSDALRASSFAELLDPIPNAVSLLKAVDESQAQSPTDANVQLAQYYRYYRHHHHHHHHHFWRRYHHHHHHHHHHGYFRYY
jgi:outer membrane protein assembly factor BamD (BamD/ComL family)